LALTHFLRSPTQVRDDLERLKSSASQQDVMDNFGTLGHSIVELTDRAGRRQMVRSTAFL